jgi:hypothetical protein
VGTYDGFLMRDALNDNGVIPSPGYPYYSPDVIAHAQVADPNTFFSQNWGNDPSQAIELGSRLNPVYVRAKNLSTSPLSNYYISVFRASPALFLTPSLWKSNPLTTTSGNTFVALPTVVQPGAVGVGQDCFMLDAIASNLFCMVGIASPTQQPALPPDFSSYSAYLQWVSNNQNVCGRNLNLVRDYANRSFQRLDSFSNPSPTDTVPTLFQVTVTGNLPAATQFGLTCAPLGISTSWTYSTPVQTTSGRTPPSFNGTVETWATLPGSAQWPAGASINTEVFVGVQADDPVAYMATPLERLGVAHEDVEGLGATGRLVRLGNCETLFTTP